MNIGNISAFGIWDSKKNRIVKSTASEARPVICFEFEFIISGSGKIYINDTSCPIVSNLLVVAKPGQKRRSIADFKTYFFHIDIDKSFEFYDNVTDLPDFIFTTEPAAYIKLFSDIIIFLVENGKNTNNIYFNSKFLELIHLLKTDSVNSKKTFKSTNMRKTHKIINQIIEYINGHYEDTVSLKDLSLITNYSPNYIQNVFSSATGMSPNEYLTSERIKKAKELLISTDAPIVDIAYACGFSSQSYFAKAFRKNLFCTPTEYRNMTQKST